MTAEFTVIIPTLNEEQFLPQLLQDLSEQTFRNFQVIIVDAQSEDNTKVCAQSYQQSMNLRFLEAPEKGVSHQRNYGATQTDSPFVFFIDADARLEPETLQNAHTNIDSWKHLVYLPMHVPQESKFDDSAMQSTINFLTEISQITDKPFSYGPSMIFEHNFFTFIGGFNEEVTFFEDHEIVQRARRSGVIAKLLKDVRVQFSMRRFQEEGRFKVLQKYLIATAHMYTKGEITDNLFEYEWGGKRYTQSPKDASLEGRFKKHISQMKTYINTLIEKGNIV